MTWSERIESIADSGSFIECDSGLTPGNPIASAGYEEKVAAAQKKCGTKEAVVTGFCAIKGIKAAVGVMDSRFIMASMGSVVGEKIARLFETAAREKLPIVIFAASGGARMQEGVVSLMQMAKTSGAVVRHSEAGGLFISVMTDPTTGGVMASFASLGDIIIAERGALIGFAGKRVMRATIGVSLPEEFQTAEFFLSRGFVDMITGRLEMRDRIAALLELHAAGCPGVPPPARALSVRPGAAGLSLTERLALLRSIKRPGAQDYIPLIFEDFIELRGDRFFGDDTAITGGIARFQGRPVTVIAQTRGHTIEELKRTNFSMAHPEGYRKALRLAKQAEKFRRPVICFIDTPGAFCGEDAEERGQGAAIAGCIAGFMALKTPVVSVVLGQGGSGGALALGVCDDLAMLENSMYSVISPRGFASILWKDPGREKEAAREMKITAEDLRGLGICDSIIPEAPGGAHNDVSWTAANIADYLSRTLSELAARNIDRLLEGRYQKFRNIGSFTTA
jgi:acetyl-CoA carboxylase carboxyl transferase subunit beta